MSSETVTHNGVLTRANAIGGPACPACEGTASYVVDSRPAKGRQYRRRNCCACGYRFTTQERVEGVAAVDFQI